MSEADPVRRGPGRPPKLRECARCFQSKPSRDFSAYDEPYCRECRRTTPGLPPQLRWQIPGPNRQSEIIADVLGQQRMAAAIASIVAGFKCCACCFESRHVRDVVVAGRAFCALCAVQVEACGRCETHRSAQFAPELATNVVPHVPQEVLALFHVGFPPGKPKPPPDVEPDDDP